MCDNKYLVAIFGKISAYHNRIQTRSGLIRRISDGIELENNLLNLINRRLLRSYRIDLIGIAG